MRYIHLYTHNVDVLQTFAQKASGTLDISVYRWTFSFTIGQFLFLYRTISRTITVIAIVISSGQYIILNHMTRRAECGVYLVVGQIRSARPLKPFTTVHIPSFNLFLDSHLAAASEATLCLFFL